MSETQTDCCVVELEIQRVQTYLFAAPKLKVMVGANALLGETCRGILRSGAFCEASDSLPKLAVDCGAHLPSGVSSDGLGVPRADDKDPLRDSHDELQDNPHSAYEQGILVRDASRFHAVFPDEGSANCFLRKARRLLACKLPGVRLNERIKHLALDGGRWRILKEEVGPQDASSQENGETWGESLLDLPQFQVCEVSGHGPASEADEDPDDGDREIRVSAEIRRKEHKATDFDKGRTHDVLGLLRGQIEGRLKESLPNGAEFIWPNEFKELAVGGYIAVVHADGNNVSGRFELVAGNRGHNPRGGADDSKDEWYSFEREARTERFFHSMRVAVRKALVAAVVETFSPVVTERSQTTSEKNPKIRIPLRLLMLGGDDLLLVCGAPYALPFIKEYAKGLADQELHDKQSLTIGAGVAMVPASFPFHHAHDLAEQLAGSAKTLCRGLEDQEKCSVVDWISTSESWHDDIKEVRRNQAVVAYCTAAAAPVRADPVRGDLQSPPTPDQPVRADVQSPPPVRGDLQSPPTPDQPVRADLQSAPTTETLLLTRKPYLILSEDAAGTEPGRSLEGLLEFVKELGETKTQGTQKTPTEAERGDAPTGRPARNQLKALAEMLPKGRRQAELALRVMPSHTREKLKGLFGAMEVSNASPWGEVSDGVWATSVLDFLELYELSLLTKTEAGPKPPRTEAGSPLSSESSL